MFIHIPKVAGCSVDEALGIWSKHHTAAQRQADSPVLFDEYFKFSFVRNPFSRLVSAWDFIRQGGLGFKDDLRDQKILLGYGDSFADFCRDGLVHMAESANHFVPQFWFVCGPGNKLMVNFIGKYENLEGSWGKVKHYTGITCNLPHVNKTKGNRKPWRSYYEGNDAAKHVVETYKVDFEIFGYSEEI